MNYESVFSEGASKVTCLAEACLYKENKCFIVSGLISGKVEIRDAQDQQAQRCVFQPKVMLHH